MEYKKLKSLTSDLRYGKAEIYQNKKDENDLKLKKTITNLSKKNIQKIKNEISNKNENLQTPENLEIFPEKNEIEITYDYKVDFFDAKNVVIGEVIILFKDILKGLIFLKKQGKCHKFINKEFIVFNTRNFKYLLIQKVYDDFFRENYFEDNLKRKKEENLNGENYSNMTEEMENKKFLKNRVLKNFEENKNYFISPLFFEKSLKNEKIDDSLKISNDVFCLGLFCLIYFINLEKIQELYDFKNGIFKKKDFFLILKEIFLKSEDYLEKAFFDFLISFVFKMNLQNLEIEEIFLALKFVKQFETLFEYDEDLIISEKDKIFGKNNENLKKMKNRNKDIFENLEGFMNLENKKEKEISLKRLNLLKNQTTFENQNIKNMMAETAEILKTIKKKETDEKNLLRKRTEELKIKNTKNLKKIKTEEIIIKSFSKKKTIDITNNFTKTNKRQLSKSLKKKKDKVQKKEV